MAEIKTRPIGKALFGVNFEPTGQAPLDARLVVENMETLLANETYVDRGNNFYEGMPVIVKQGKSGKSELWVLIDGTKVTEEAGWQRLDADGAAIDGNIEDAINSLNATVSAEGAHVSVEVVETKGKLTEITVTEDDIASATELTNTIKKIGTGFDATNTVAKAISDEASNRDEAITNAIAALDKADNVVDGKFVDSVSEANGIITVTRKSVASNKVTAVAVGGSADTVAIEGETVDAQIKSLGKTLKTVQDNAAKYEVEKVETGLPVNIEARYQVVSYVGTKTDVSKTKVGEFIDIPKDGQLKNVEVTKNAKNEPTVIKFTYVLGDGGAEKVVEVDLGKAIFESEIGNGLQTDSSTGVISVKRDAASETFLTVSADGVKLSGVQDAINNAVAAKNVTAVGDAYVSANVSNNKVTVASNVQPLVVGKTGAADSTITGTENSLVDGKEVADKVASFTNARISEEIAKLDVSDIGEEGKFITKVSEVDGKIAAEFVQVKANEVKLEQIGEVDANGIKLNATTVQEGIAELFTKILDNEEVDAAAINKIKTILGITGEELKYETKSDDTIIGAATSYSDADVKLAEAIRTAQDNAITIQAGNGVNITSNGSEKTINVKVVNDDKLITVDNSGIHTKDNAVFDCGIY